MCLFEIYCLGGMIMGNDCAVKTRLYGGSCGGGMTWALLLPAIEFALRGRRVIRRGRFAV